MAAPGRSPVGDHAYEIESSRTEGAIALVEFGHDGSWYLSGATVDTSARPDYQSGLWHSTDQGMTWEPADEGLYPSRIVWRLTRGVRPGEMIVGLWGGGFAATAPAAE